MRRWLRPFAAYGAKASFSLYALHFPIIAFTAAWLLETERLLASGANIALVIVTLAFTVFACGLLRHSPNGTPRGCAPSSTASSLPLTKRAPIERRPKKLGKAPRNGEG